jgi:RNA polymerase-binding protein DksA
LISPKMGKDLRKRLVTHRAQLVQEISNLANGGIRADTFQADEANSSDQDPADAASELFEREKNLALQRTLEISVVSVDAALQKFENGSYGQCETCGTEIPEKRLIALPEATHCISCQSKLERQHSLSRR